MKRYEEKQNDAGNSLNQVEPVSWIRIGEIVWPRLNSNYKTIDGVIDERYKDSADFDEQDIRNRLQIFYGIIEGGGSVKRLRVRVEMFQQEDAEGHDAGKLMKFAQDESPAQSYAHAHAPMPQGNNAKAVGPDSSML